MNATSTAAASYASPSQLVSVLEERGLRIDDRARAERYLGNISYFRLSSYLHPLLTLPKEANHFKPDATFDQALTLYRFDRKLRLLLFNEIEKIEVALRAKLINEGCEATSDVAWITKEEHFADRTRFKKTLTLIDSELAHSHEDFVESYRRQASNTSPSAWMLTEILPLGVVTNIYSNIKDKRIKKRIARHFGLMPAPFESWMTIVTLTRNACCHHARVWNKQNTIKPMMPERTDHEWLTLATDPLRIYFNLCIIKYLLDRISPNNDLKGKLLRLLADFPSVDPVAMGFTSDWQTEPRWRG